MSQHHTSEKDEKLLKEHGISGQPRESAAKHLLNLSALAVREKAITLLGGRVYGRSLFGSDNWVGMDGREGTIDRGSHEALKGLVERIGQLEERAAELEKKASKTN